MKSAYELAMERLEKQSPAVKVTDEQRQALAEIDATYKAKIAEREVFLASQITKAAAPRDAAWRWKTSAATLARGAPVAGRVRGEEGQAAQTGQLADCPRHASCAAYCSFTR